jgi:energy-coupling factor transport system substrate-specific component
MKNTVKFSIFLIPIGIAINLIGGQLALLLKLPIFLDSIGTITVGALCGPIPGMIVGAVTNMGLSITNPQTLFYIGNNIIFGLLSGFLARRGFFSRIPKVLLTGIIFGIIGGTLGATISILFFDALGAGGTGVVTGALMNAGFPPVVAAYASELFADLTDKIPTVFIVYLILRSIPSRTLIKMPQGEALLAFRKAPKAGAETK